MSARVPVGTPLSPAVRVGGEATRAAVHIRVEGIPAPQGSHKAFVVGKRAVIVNDNARTRPWKDAVRDAARIVLARDHHPWTPISGAVTVTVTFWLPRPKSHYGTGRNAGHLRPGAPEYPAVKPDLDKLVRAALDAIGEAEVWADDAQVVAVRADKGYTTFNVGADITVWPVR